MGLLPEQQNDLATYIRETKGTPYAPYNNPVENGFVRGVMLVTLFPLLGILLPIAVDNTIIDLLSYAMLGLCPLLGIATIAICLGADAAHKKDDADAEAAKAKTSRMLSSAGLALGVAITTVAVAVAFYGFLGGKGGHSAEGGEKKPAAAEAPAEGGEGEEAAEGAKPAEGEKAGDAAAEKKDGEGE
jgi:hypothetical protein